MSPRWTTNISTPYSMPVISQTEKALSVGEEAFKMLEEMVEQNKEGKPYSERVKKKEKDAK